MADLGGSLWALITIGFVVNLAAPSPMGHGCGRAPRAIQRPWRAKMQRRNYSPDAVEEKPILWESAEDEDKERKKRRA